jgi:hypothetical protein
MKYGLLLFLALAFFNAGPAQALEFEKDQLSFDFLAVDGAYWYDCTHKPTDQPHRWIAFCGPYQFNLHLMLIEYPRKDETTYEFHYWADEVTTLNETHTQSIWLTVDQQARAKKIVGYLGFLSDSAQLRIEIQLKKIPLR